MNEKTPTFSLRIIVTVTYLLMILMNALANILPINGKGTGEISDSYPNLFAPDGITFAIWGVIYLLLGLFVLYQLGCHERRGESRKQQASYPYWHHFFHLLGCKQPVDPGLAL